MLGIALFTCIKESLSYVNFFFIRTWPLGRAPRLLHLGSTTRHLNPSWKNPPYALVQWRIQDFWKGVSAFGKTPLQFELKTKKRSSTFMLLFRQCVMHLHCIISNKTTAIKASPSDCSIRVFKLPGFKSISLKGGFRGNFEIPPKSTTVVT